MRELAANVYICYAYGWQHGLWEHTRPSDRQQCGQHLYMHSNPAAVGWKLGGTIPLSLSLSLSLCLLNEGRWRTCYSLSSNVMRCWGRDTSPSVGWCIMRTNEGTHTQTNNATHVFVGMANNVSQDDRCRGWHRRRLFGISLWNMRTRASLLTNKEDVDVIRIRSLEPILRKCKCKSKTFHLKLHSMKFPTKFRLILLCS